MGAMKISWWPPYIVPLAKLTIVPFVLWLISQSLANEHYNEILKIDWLFIVPAIIVNQIALILFAIRMQVMLGLFNITISRLQSLRIHLQSMFYFFALPMTVGLEAARFAKIKSIAGEGAQAVTLGSALLTDRLIGALVSLFFSAILFSSVNFEMSPQWNMRVSLAVVLGGGGLIFLLSLHGRIRSYIREAIGLIFSERKGLWIAVIAAVSTHLVFALGIYLAAMAVHLQITFIQTVFAVSTAMLFVIFPVSFAGVGPVEAATFGVLLGLGVPMEQAVIFAFISYVAKLIAAFEGGGWELYEGGEYVSQLLLKMRKEKT